MSYVNFRLHRRTATEQSRCCLTVMPFRVPSSNVRLEQHSSKVKLAHTRQLADLRNLSYGVAIKMEKIDTDVAKLVSMIEDGELQLPEMQRRYVWPATRVRDLLDSLYRGYPSGAILVWETDREVPSRDLAVEQNRSPFKGHKLLLDGQQRLTSLTATLRGKPVTVRDRRRPIEILFNLAHPEGPPIDVLEVDDEPGDSDPEGAEQDGNEDEQNLQERLNQRTFVVSSSALLADPRWVRVSDVFSGAGSDAQFLKPLVASFDDPAFDKYSKRLQALRKIREYPYVMHVLDKSLSYEEVAEIFVRVNSLGMKLRGSDLALAQITSRWQHSLKMLEDFQDECEQSLYSLDLGVFVRTLVVFATGQSRFKTVGTTPVTKLKKGWEEAKEGLRFESVIVKSVAGMLNAKGGALLIGVDDKGMAIGLKHDYGTLSTRPNRDGYEQALTNLFSTSFGKDIVASLSINFQEISGHDICIVQIPMSSKPVYVADGNRERLFVRIGNTTQELNTKESVSYVKSHWLK